MVKAPLLPLQLMTTALNGIWQLMILALALFLMKMCIQLTLLRLTPQVNKNLIVHPLILLQMRVMCKMLLQTSSSWTKLLISMHFANHKVPDHSLINSAALVDYGANGGIVGYDICLLKTGEKHADFNGINNIQLSNFPTADLVPMAYHGKGSIIFSSGHMEAYKIKVDGGSIHIGGKQRIEIMDDLPCVVLTSNQGWDPGMYFHQYKHPST